MVYETSHCSLREQLSVLSGSVNFSVSNMGKLMSLWERDLVQHLSS